MVWPACVIIASEATGSTAFSSTRSSSRNPSGGRSRRNSRPRFRAIGALQPLPPHRWRRTPRARHRPRSIPKARPRPIGRRGKGPTPRAPSSGTRPRHNRDSVPAAIEIEFLEAGHCRGNVVRCGKLVFGWPGRHREILPRLTLRVTGPGNTTPFIRQPSSAMLAEMVRFASKLPNATATPPTSEPSDMPKKSALLFQASAVPRRLGKSLTRPTC
jgi:hypothetical protein